MPHDWFSFNSKHALNGRDGIPRPHAFFDVKPEMIRQERYVNAVLVTPKNSEFAYELDLNSGQRFYSHTYCKQKDIWNLQSGTFKVPHFGIGVIPRTLDQLGDPQQVLIFSDRNLTENIDTNYYRLKIVGGVIKQECLEGNCLGKSHWPSRLVLIGVDVEDPNNSQIQNVDDFKKIYHWDDTKATLENIDGRNFIGTKTYPSVRIGNLIPAEEAFSFFEKHSIKFNEKEMSKIRNGCQNLYEKLYEIAQQSKKENDFSKKVSVFTQQFYPEIATCEKLVYHGNINDDSEKFWFLSYMQIFYRMHKDGYAYDCKTRNWQKNVYNSEGVLVFDLKRDIKKCSDEDLDQAMTYLPNFLMTLKESSPFYYRFIDYDNYSFGTHKKLYAWVKIRSKRMDCSNDPNEVIRKNLKVAPEDIVWKKRAIKNSNKNDEKIIY